MRGKMREEPNHAKDRAKGYVSAGFIEKKVKVKTPALSGLSQFSVPVIDILCY